MNMASVSSRLWRVLVGILLACALIPVIPGSQAYANPATDTSGSYTISGSWVNGDAGDEGNITGQFVNYESLIISVNVGDPDSTGKLIITVPTTNSATDKIKLGSYTQPSDLNKFTTVTPTTSGPNTILTYEWDPGYSGPMAVTIPILAMPEKVLDGETFTITSEVTGAGGAHATVQDIYTAKYAGDTVDSMGMSRTAPKSTYVGDGGTATYRLTIGTSRTGFWEKKPAGVNAPFVVGTAQYVFPAGTTLISPVDPNYSIDPSGVLTISNLNISFLSGWSGSVEVQLPTGLVSDEPAEVTYSGNLTYNGLYNGLSGGSAQNISYTKVSSFKEKISKNPSTPLLEVKAYSWPNTFYAQPMLGINATDQILGMISVKNFGGTNITNLAFDVALETDKVHANKMWIPGPGSDASTTQCWTGDLTLKYTTNKGRTGTITVSSPSSGQLVYFGDDTGSTPMAANEWVTQLKVSFPELRMGDVLAVLPNTVCELRLMGDTLGTIGDSATMQLRNITNDQSIENKTPDETSTTIPFSPSGQKGTSLSNGYARTTAPSNVAELDGEFVIYDQFYIADYIYCGDSTTYENPTFYYMLPTWLDYVEMEQTPGSPEISARLIDVAGEKRTLVEVKYSGNPGDPHYLGANLDVDGYAQWYNMGIRVRVNDNAEEGKSYPLRNYANANDSSILERLLWAVPTDSDHAQLHRGWNSVEANEFYDFNGNGKTDLLWGAAYALPDITIGPNPILVLEAPASTNDGATFTSYDNTDSTTIEKTTLKAEFESEAIYRSRAVNRTSFNLENTATYFLFPTAGDSNDSEWSPIVDLTDWALDPTVTFVGDPFDYTIEYTSDDVSSTDQMSPRDFDNLTWSTDPTGATGIRILADKIAAGSGIIIDMPFSFPDYKGDLVGKTAYTSTLMNYVVGGESSNSAFQPGSALEILPTDPPTIVLNTGNDADGNKNVDTTDPTVYLYKGTSYDEVGGTVADDFMDLDFDDDVIITEILKNNVAVTLPAGGISVADISSYIDTATTGVTYKVTYSITDEETSSAGRPATAVRDIIILNSTAATYSLPVTKQITGDTPSTPSDFVFTLEGEDATTPMPATATGTTAQLTISGAAASAFGNIIYDQTGTFSYTITEDEGKAKGYTYDTSEYTLEVEVTLGSGGVFVATPTFMLDGDDVTEVVFVNKYVADPVDTPITDGTTDADSGSTNDKRTKGLSRAGDDTPIAIIGLIGLAGIIGLTVAVRRRKED